MSTSTRPFRRGVKVRTLRTKGSIPARSVCTIIDVHPHGGGYRYRLAWQTPDGALLAEEWIAGRDVVRASRSTYRPVEVST